MLMRSSFVVSLMSQPLNTSVTKFVASSFFLTNDRSITFWPSQNITIQQALTLLSDFDIPFGKSFFISYEGPIDEALKSFLAISKQFHTTPLLDRFAFVFLPQVPFNGVQISWAKRIPEIRKRTIDFPIAAT